MASLGSYKRSQDEKDGTLHDTVKMEIQADTPEEKEECLHDLMVLHKVLEEFEVFKKDK